MVQAGEADGSLDRFGAAAGEGRAGHAFGEPVFGQALDEGRLRFGGEGGDDVGQVLERLGRDLGHFAAAVADVDDDGAAGGVEDAAAVGGDEVGAFGAGDGEGRGAFVGDEGGNAAAILLR